MEFKALLLFAAVWFVVGLIGKAGRKGGPPNPQRQPQPRRPVPKSLGTDPTQREGSRLEAVLRQVQRAMEEVEDAKRPERRSLEVEPEVASLETGFTRPGRKLVDQDDQAEEIVARRIKAAADRDVARSPADHTRFDERIRQEPAEHTAAPGYTTRQLRDAVIWREILGPPVSLRGESETDS